MTTSVDRLDVAALRAAVADAEQEWTRLDKQADTSASVRAAVLSERLRDLRRALARAEQEKGNEGETSGVVEVIAPNG